MASQKDNRSFNQMFNKEDSLFNQTIYCVYPRSHSSTGNFQGIIDDLDRISDLGISILWLLPIHPIGDLNKKGNLGCPYSIKDYRKINPEYGTLDDFKNLVRETHNRKMKLMIDVVYNHTSRDSFLLKNHPEFFFKNKKNEFSNRVGDWTDVYDLNYENKELWNYQIETLLYWQDLGVDGFRCDVASMVPLEFWIEARRRLEEKNPEIVLLAESVHLGFIQNLREQGICSHSDSELFQAFDITYDYDTHEDQFQYFQGKISLEQYLVFQARQETIYPAHYKKLRFLENHDQLRAYKLIPNLNQLINWTCFNFFQKGVPLIY